MVAASAPMADRGWKRRFDEPIPLPRGRHLVTLEDAGNYITKLPKTDHEAQEWAGGDGSLDPGGDVGRTNDVRAHRHHGSLEPRQVRSGIVPARKRAKSYRIVPIGRGDP